MSSSPKDGGPAFPGFACTDGRGNIKLVVLPNGESTFEVHEPGMTLRDYFAGLAMQSCFAGPGARMVADRDGRYNEDNWAQVVAANAYEMADAMLAAKAITPPNSLSA